MEGKKANKAMKPNTFNMKSCGYTVEPLFWDQLFGLRSGVEIFTFMLRFT